MHEPTIRNHCALIIRHVAKAEGYRDAGADPSGEYAEAKRHLVELANAFGCFVDDIDETARVSVEGSAAE